MPIISTPKYIAGSRKLVQNASGGQFLPKSHLSQIRAKELLTQAPQEFLTEYAIYILVVI
jgi:hypothetical protein